MHHHIDPRKRRSLPALWAALALLIISSLAGCGSGDGGHGGNVVYRVDWPTSRLVPVNTQSVGIVLQDENGATVQQRISGETVDRVVIQRPTNGEPNTQVTVFDVKAGTYRVVANAYPNADGTGTPMASGVTQLVIADKQVNEVDLNMGTTIASIEFTPANPTVQQGQSITVGVAAKNAAGNLVLIDPSNLIWESTDGSALTIVSSGATATITGNTPGAHQIRVTENESNRPGVATVQVTNPGGGGGGTLTAANVVIADPQLKAVIGMDQVPPTRVCLANIIVTR